MGATAAAAGGCDWTFRGGARYVLMTNHVHLLVTPDKKEA